VGEVVNLKFNCNNNIINKNGEEQKFGNLVTMDLNVLDVLPTKNEQHSNKIEVGNNIGIVMKYPTFNSIDNFDMDTQDFDKILDIIVSCVDYIYDADQVYYAKDTTKKELMEFIENLKQTDLEKLSKFFDTLPKLKKEIHFGCSKCGY
jgi:hypothetical protein